MTAGHVYFIYEKILTRPIDGAELDYTIIHKVFVFKTYIIPFADARVRGSIVNQFNMDEYSGFILRIATTNEKSTLPYSSINVFTLNYHLNIIGRLS